MGQTKKPKDWKYLVRFKSENNGKKRTFKTNRLPKAREVGLNYWRKGLFLELVNNKGTKLPL